MNKFTTILFSLLMLFGFAGSVMGQFSIDNLNVAVTEDFDGFTGAGLVSSPAAGQLNSNAWRITGMSDEGMVFGSDYTSGDFARGTGLSTGGVSTGGLYGFDVGGGFTVVGVQPTGSDFAPGEITLRIQNNTDAEITDLDVAYDIYVLNDQERSSSFNFAHSSDDGTYTDIGTLDYTTPEVSDELGWTEVNRSETISGLSIGIGEFYYLQWKSDDVGGGGSRDEFGLTNLSITADGDEITEPVIVATPTSLTGFEYRQGNGPSTEQSFNVSGTNLEGDITITPPTNYEISEGTGGSFAPSNPITLTETDGEVPETPIYVRLKSGLSESSYNNENIQLASTNADQVNITASGEVTPPIPSFTTAGYDQDFSNFTDAESLPNGWVLDEVYTYHGAFSSSTTTSGIYGEDALGIQLLTSSSGSDFSATLTMKNETGNTIEALSIAYDGLVERLSATRLPEWTVKIDDVEVSDLNYKTELGEDQQKHIIVSGLNIADDAEFEVEWSSSNDNSNSGSNRKIGITNVAIEAIEHYVDLTGGEGWRILSSPTSDNTYGDLLGPLWTQGIPTGANTTSGEASVQTFENDSDSFSGINDMGTTMSAGIGFITYVYADVEYDGDAESFPKTIGVNGTENTGSISPTLNSGADEWTLVGNPYNSTIEWDELTKTDLTGTVYVYDHSYGTPSGDDVEASESAGSYRVWNGTSGSLTEGLITPFQGFWVQNASSGTPVLTIEEADRTTGGTFYKESASESISIKLRGEMENMFSEAYLSFTEHGEIEKDNFDALKLEPLDFRNYLSLSTITGDEKLDINNLPNEFEGEIEVPVSIKAFQSDAESKTWIEKSGEIEFSWPEMENIPEDWSVTLHDYETGESVDMLAIDSYSFTIEGNQQKTKAAPQLTILNPQPPQVEMARKSDEQDPRFVVTIMAATSVSNEPTEAPSTFTLEQNYPNPFNPVTQIQYSLANAGNVTLEVYNIAGQRVETLVNERKSSGTYRVSWDAANMASGIYYYRLQAGNQVLTRQMTLIK